MRKYSKAYYLKDLRKFSGWEEMDRPDKDELEDDTIVFVQDNFTVVKDCFEEEDYIYNDVTDEWKEFCEKELKFEIPEDLRYAYEEDEEGEAAEEGEGGEATDEKAEAKEEAKEEEKASAGS